MNGAGWLPISTHVCCLASTHNTKHFLFQSVAKLCLTHLGLSQRNGEVFDSGDVEKPIHTSKEVQFIFQRKISQGFPIARFPNSEPSGGVIKSDKVKKAKHLEHLEWFPQ